MARLHMSAICLGHFYHYLNLVKSCVFIFVIGKRVHYRRIARILSFITHEESRNYKIHSLVYSIARKAGIKKLSMPSEFPSNLGDVVAHSPLLLKLRYTMS